MLLAVSIITKGIEKHRLVVEATLFEKYNLTRGAFFVVAAEVFECMNKRIVKAIYRSIS